MKSKDVCSVSSPTLMNPGASEEDSSMFMLKISQISCSYITSAFWEAAFGICTDVKEEVVAASSSGK